MGKYGKIISVATNRVYTNAFTKTNILKYYFKRVKLFKCINIETSFIEIFIKSDCS